MPEQHKYRDLVFDVPELSTHGVRSIANDAGIFGTIGNAWNPAEFARPHTPVRLGRATCLQSQNARVRVLDMPIRFPGTNYRVPRELAGFIGDIDRIADYDSLLMRGDTSRYCYLTVDFGTVPAGKTPRNGGCHVDGFQGERIQPKVPIDHTYIAVSAVPTVFYKQTWDVGGLDPKHDNFFHAFDQQANPSAERMIDPNAIYLMDAYSVHKCSVPTEATFRIFLRMAYSVRQFDRLGNTHNPMFDYQWNMVPRALNLEPRV